MSLTPADYKEQVSNEAMHEGMIAGGLTLVPSASVVYFAVQKSPFFRLRTNWQSRTAMAIMPALFAFAYTSETYLHHRMQDMAAQTIAQQQQPQKNQTRISNFSALVDQQQQTKKPMEEGQTARDLLTL